jgi:ribosomal-protein-alanine N-acetyltransferase
LPEAHNCEVIVRAATVADLAEIAAIQLASPAAAQWDSASYLHYDCEVAVVGNRVAGFLVTRQTTRGEREILNLAVDPERRRQGVARRLLRDELNRCKGTWFLEVRESNAAAIGLYRSAGFEIAGHRPGYYNDPQEAGVVMRFLS